MYGVKFPAATKFTVLLMDVDIVFTDPRAMPGTAAALDMVMAAPRFDSLGLANSGFVYFRPTQAARIFLQSFENIAALKRRQDQPILNALLRHRMMHQLSWRVLSQDLFTTLQKAGNLSLTRESTVAHVISTNKRVRLQKAGLWFLNPARCPREVWNDKAVSALPQI